MRAAGGGFAYRWAQDLCGLNFPPISGALSPVVGGTVHIGDVIDAIRRRFETISALKSQVDSLRESHHLHSLFDSPNKHCPPALIEKLNLPSVPPKVVESLFPLQGSARLAEWHTLTSAPSVRSAIVGISCSWSSSHFSLPFFRANPSKNSVLLLRRIVVGHFPPFW